MHSRNSPFFFGTNRTGLPICEKDGRINFLFKFLSMYSLTVRSSWSDILYIGPVFSCAPSFSFISWSHGWCLGSGVSSSLAILSACFFWINTFPVFQLIHRFSFWSHLLPNRIWWSPSSVMSKFSFRYLLLSC